MSDQNSGRGVPVPRPDDVVPTAPHVDAAAPYQPYEAVQQDNYKDSGWSWGGALLNVAFLFATRRYVLATMLVLGPPVVIAGLTLLAYSAWPVGLLLVPLANIAFLLFWVGVAIYVGIAGRRIARTCGVFENRDEYVGFMKAVDHAGKVLAIIFLVCGVLGGMLVAVSLASLGSARERAQVATYKAEVQRYLPTLVIACDIERLRSDHLVDTISVDFLDTTVNDQSCGPSGDGTFTVRARSTNRDIAAACGVTTITESGVTHSGGC